MSTHKADKDIQNVQRIHTNLKTDKPVEKYAKGTSWKICKWPMNWRRCSSLLMIRECKLKREVKTIHTAEWLKSKRPRKEHEVQMSLQTLWRSNVSWNDRSEKQALEQFSAKHTMNHEHLHQETHTTEHLSECSKQHYSWFQNRKPPNCPRAAAWGKGYIRDSIYTIVSAQCRSTSRQSWTLGLRQRPLGKRQGVMAGGPQGSGMLTPCAPRLVTWSPVFTQDQFQPWWRFHKFVAGHVHALCIAHGAPPSLSGLHYPHRVLAAGLQEVFFLRCTCSQPVLVTCP